MGQTHSSQQVTGRFYCENDSCSNPRTHYCSDCDQVLCTSCSVSFHQKCSATMIPDAKVVTYCLDITKSVLSSIRQDSKHLKTSSSTNNFDEELKTFTEKLSIINEKFTTSIENNNSHEFCSIIKEVVQLQNELVESDLIIQSNLSKEFKLALLGEHLSCQMIAELQGNVNKTTLIDHRREFNEEDLDRLNCKCTNKTTKNQIEFTRDEKSFKGDLKSNLEYSNEPIHYERDSEQIDKSKQEEHKHVISSTNWKEIKQRELKILKQERKIQEVVFSRIYQRHTGIKIPDIPSFHLKISINDANQKCLMRDFMTSRLKLPDLNGIQIDYIPDADADLASFLSDYTPVRLQLLCFNCDANSYIGIKSRFYVAAFSKAARRTEKEVYFNCIDFSAEDLQTVVRASHNAERIVFDFCCIHCSPGLDFGADLSYKTNLLSFQWCGSKYHKERTTDWKADPSSFSFVVDAIGSSCLRASLKKLNIASNQTLSGSKVQEELNEKGMSYISVVEEYSNSLPS